MDRAQGDERCQHAGCGCPRPAPGDYCSDHRANAWEGGTDEECGCGHPGCG